MKRTTFLLILVVAMVPVMLAQRTDFSGMKFCIDPGHGGHNAANDRYVVPDEGTEFWESESNFQKALRLDTLLTARGATVILTRYTNDYPADDEPSLSARYTLANANNVNWFHSIHSNATGWSSNTTVNSTLMEVSEKIVAGGDPVYGPGTGQPVFPEAWTMCTNYIGPNIKKNLRTSSQTTYLDWTFNANESGQHYTLGVLRGLAVPGLLSEGSFHDYFPETRRLMSNLYRKMEAYAHRNSYMQYFGVPADTLGIIAGIQTNAETSKPMNLSRVRLLPLDRVVMGDSFNNGFYMFDNVPAGTYILRFETPGYRTDSVQVALVSGAVLFVDKSLLSQAYPTVLLAGPANSDTTVMVTSSVVLTFSRPMDTASVRAAFSILPAVPGTLKWTNANATVTFTPAINLDLWTTYHIRVDTTARSAYDQPFDGNGDGVAGDPYVASFRTKYFDVFPPGVVSTHPGGLSDLPVPSPVVNITFDERLNQSCVTTSNFVIQLVGGSQLYRTLEYVEENGRGGVTMYMPGGIAGGKSYTVRLSRIADLLGNTMPTTSSILWSFSTATGTYSSEMIDSVNPGTTGFSSAMDPGDRFGVESLAISPTASKKVGILTGNPGSLSVHCVWDTSSTSWRLRVPLDSTSAGGRIRFQKTGTVLRAYVYGDGSGSQVRFAIADSLDALSGKAAPIEVSRWFTMDWVGWRAIHWDLENDSLGSYMGTGVLEGTMRFDGLQFQYAPGANAFTLQTYVDQIEILRRTPTGIDGYTPGLPHTCELKAAYPNPFNPAMKIGYSIGMVSREPFVAPKVRLAVYDLLGREMAILVDEVKTAGSYEAQWDASRFSSGVYVIRLIVTGATGSPEFMASQKAVLMK
jgi:N-acetylmuramoyl-L-alanine amidase